MRKSKTQSLNICSCISDIVTDLLYVNQVKKKVIYMPAYDLLGIECDCSPLHNESIPDRDYRLALLVHTRPWPRLSLLM